jgi:hypothetical protein
MCPYSQGRRSNMLVALAILLAFLPAISVEVPHDPGLYYLTPQGLVRIEGRSVTVEGGRSKIPVKHTFPVVGDQAKAAILGPHAELKVSDTPVFYYRAPSSGESTGAGDLVLVKLKSHKNRREFTISAQGEWKESSGIPLQSQVEFNSRRVESGVFRLEPSDDLEAGEYGFYLFRGHDMPGFLYDFTVPAEK